MQLVGVDSREETLACYIQVITVTREIFIGA